MDAAPRLRKEGKPPVDSFDLATYPKQPAPEGAPRKLAEIPLEFRCICASLAAWARPCAPCKWSKKGT